MIALNLKLIHYSNKKLERLWSTTSQMQDDDISPYTKPTGLWLSEDSGEDGWRHWIDSEGWRTEEYIIATEIELIEPESILILTSANELDRFTNEYGEMSLITYYRSPCIKWGKVAEKYKGIIITPYIWERRMELNWYYGWDCASGCIWDVSCLRIKK